MEAEPDRDLYYYKWVEWWYRQPKNHEKARNIEKRCIEAMQKDKRLD